MAHPSHAMLVHPPCAQHRHTACSDRSLPLYRISAKENDDATREAGSTANLTVQGGNYFCPHLSLTLALVPLCPRSEGSAPRYGCRWGLSPQPLDCPIGVCALSANGPQYQPYGQCVCPPGTRGNR